MLEKSSENVRNGEIYFFKNQFASPVLKLAKSISFWIVFLELRKTLGTELVFSFSYEIIPTHKKSPVSHQQNRAFQL